MSMSGYITGSLVREHGESMGNYLFAEFLKGQPDSYILRPLWEFPGHERKAVLHERAKRFGVPDAKDDFDHEYH
jgi:hypothetical protein